MATVRAGNKALDTDTISLYLEDPEFIDTSRVSTHAPTGETFSLRGQFTVREVTDCHSLAECFLFLVVEDPPTYDEIRGTVNSFSAESNGSLEYEVTGLTLGIYTDNDPHGSRGGSTVGVPASYLLAGNDGIFGSGFGDRLSGYGGNDILTGGAGADTLIGGFGNDTASYTDSPAPVVVNLGAGRGTGGDAAGDRLVDIENLIGSAKGDRLTGNPGNNRLSGGNGADDLRGAGGSDQLQGGAGADRLDGGAGIDTATYATSAAGVAVNLATGAGAGGEAAGDRLVNVENVTGSQHSDRLLGDSGPNTLNGGAGDDDLRGGGGDDSYMVDHPGDITKSLADPATDTIRSIIPYRLGTEQENLVLLGSAGIAGTGNALANVLTGNSGANTLTGGAGNDRLIGGAGHDDLRGGGGDDTYEVDHVGDITKALADPGTDTVRSSVSYRLGPEQEYLTLIGRVDPYHYYAPGNRLNGTGNEANNVITGDGGDNVLTGLGGDDILVGGGGSDRLVGGAGKDTLRGGDGFDVLVFQTIDAGADGGDGYDTLQITGAGITLDATNLTVVSNIETIDLRGSGANTLILDPALISALSSITGYLDVLADADDTVILDGHWIYRGISGYLGFDEYRDYDGPDGASVSVQDDATVAFVLNGSINTSLGDLTGGEGFRLDGIDAGDFSGLSVAGAGDVNGDGFDDFIIGAPRDGESYVVFGAAGGFPASFDLASLDGTNGFRVDGGTFTYSGRFVAGGGDINGDGFDDLLISASDLEIGGITYSVTGKGYVVFGKAGGFAASFNLASLDGINGFRLNSDSNIDVHSVADAGDVNGDGFADLIIATDFDYSGETYIVFGKASGFPAGLDLSSLDGTDGFRLNASEPRDGSGYSVAGAGDVNGDGFADLIIGAPYGNQTGFGSGSTGTGASYVVFGKAGGFGANESLSSLDGTNGFRIGGIDPRDAAGYSVAGAGDINGDGFDDLSIGAHQAEGDGGTYSDSGETYVVFGKANGFPARLDLGSLDGTNGFRIDGIGIGDESGISVAGAGDINGDGFDDLIIGASDARSIGGIWAGETYIVFGHAGGFGASLDLESLDGANGFWLAGIDDSGHSGRSVAGAGDINGDGFDDLLIGAPFADPNGDSGAGRSYVIFGRDFRSEVDVPGTEGDDTLIGTEADNILIGGLGDDILDGGDGADVLKGAAGDDVFVYDNLDRVIDGGTGIDTLLINGAGAALDLTAIADNALTGFEIIHLSGSGDNSLTLNKLEALNLSDAANTLRVDGNAGDQVHFGSGWTQGGDITIGSQLYHTYTQDAAILQVDADIMVLA